MQKIHNAPQIFRRIFQRRSRKNDFMCRCQVLAAFCIGGTRIFDVLRFVKDQIRKLYAAQKIAAETGSSIRKTNQIIICTFFKTLFTFCTFGSSKSQARNKFFSFTLPIWNQRCRTNNERRRIPGTQTGSKKRQKLNSFTQSHFVSKNHIEITVSHPRKKRNALFLIGTQSAVEFEFRRMNGNRFFT